MHVKFASDWENNLHLLNKRHNSQAMLELVVWYILNIVKLCKVEQWGSLAHFQELHRRKVSYFQFRSIWIIYHWKTHLIQTGSCRKLERMRMVLKASVLCEGLLKRFLKYGLIFKAESLLKRQSYKHLPASVGKCRGLVLVCQWNSKPASKQSLRSGSELGFKYISDCNKEIFFHSGYLAEEFTSPSSFSQVNPVSFCCLVAEYQRSIHHNCTLTPVLYTTLQQHQRFCQMNSYCGVPP